MNNNDVLGIMQGVVDAHLSGKFRKSIPLPAKTLRNFLKHLCVSHPIGLRVRLCLVDGPVDTVQGNGMGEARGYAGSDTAYIYVDRTLEPLVCLMVLAHEYRHIMTWLIPNFKREHLGEQAWECDAQAWAQPVASDYFYRNCCKPRQ